MIIFKILWWIFVFIVFLGLIEAIAENGRRRKNENRL